jgi:hypothetical protein
MIVRELIEKLQEVDQNLIVFIYDENSRVDSLPLDGIEVSKDVLLKLGIEVISLQKLER